MPLTPEEHEALVKSGMAPWQVENAKEKKKWPPPKSAGWVAKLAEISQKPKVVKKKPAPLEHWSTVPDASEAWDWDDAEIEYVDADVDYPIVEKFTEELEHMKVPMQTRRSNKRVGLTCKAVQLLSKTLDQTCCSECHDFAKRRPEKHQMQWVPTPANPPEFDVGQAYVCCRYRKVCSNACVYGWEKVANQTATLDPSKVWEKLITDAASPGAHMTKVVELTWLNSAPMYDATILAKMGFSHLPQLRVHVSSPFASAAAITEEFCNNPRCVTCAWDKNTYWSYKLQCWFRYNLYAIFDNGANLSNTHGSLAGHSCGGKVLNGKVWVPESEMWTCRYDSSPDLLPVWGAQYDADPRHHAAMKWWDSDDHDFRWILHAPDKDVAPELSAPYKFLVWDVVGL